jgi:hypothetical protein
LTFVGNLEVQVTIASPVGTIATVMFDTFSYGDIGAMEDQDVPFQIRATIRPPSIQTTIMLDGPAAAIIGSEESVFVSERFRGDDHVRPPLVDVL